MADNKVLIITYYWPPSGGSGVQRWLKFVKYLPQFGWTPYVFTPENPSFDVKDESLLRDVPAEAKIIRFPIWEPYQLFFQLSGMLGKKKTAKPNDLVTNSKKSLFQNISTWIRGNFFIPDPRKFWAKPASQFLDKYVREHGIKTIITTGPPHSMHLVGLRLKKKNPSLKWIVDFRDPWSEWGFLDTLKVGSIARSRHQSLEQQVLKSADEIITITPFYVRRFEKLSGKKVKLLTNGYDEEDFKSIQLKRTDKFKIRHVGIINEKVDPKPFADALFALVKKDQSFASSTVVEFIGEVHANFKGYIMQFPELSAMLRFPGSMPHKQLLATYGESSLLLLILTGYKDAEGYMPGKLFEYLATGIPVLGIGPENGDAAAMLNETKAGIMFSGANAEVIGRFLQKSFQAWQSGSAMGKSGGHTKYSRREIAQELTRMLI